MRHPLRAAAGSLLLAAAAGAQSPDLSAQFATPPGTSVSLWAESPLFYNPTAIDIDPQGRVWITEAVNYRQWDGRNPGRHHDEGDRVVVVEDRDGDGRAETSTVFLQDKDLVSPLGICWLPDKVLVSCSPTVWAVYDDDGDLRADRKEVFLTGFGGFNHDHGAHSFSVGPDGRLHMALGNAGPHVVTDKSGWTLRSGSIYDDGGPAPAGNRPGLVSDDGRTYVGGLILRCNQDGTGLTVMAHNFRNPYEVAVDAFGDLWTFDNDDDGNQCCRVTWVMEGGNYGYFSADGSRYWQADRRPGQSVQTAHWHQDDPGVVPTTLITGSGGPTGVCVYEGEALPEPLRGALLCADAGRNCVYALRREADGAGFRLLPVEGAPPVNGLTPDGTQLSGILVSKPAQDGDETWRLFRPSDVCVAPDGSVLVADWFDPGVGGHMAGDRAAYGRLLRVAASGSPGRLEGTDAGRSSEARLEKLASPAQSVRAATFTQLMAAAWIPFDSLEAMQRDPALDPGVRARMAWFEARHRDVPTLNFPALQGRHPPREAAGPPDTAQDPAAALTWSDEQAALAWRLHPESLVPAFLARAQSPSLAHAARVQSLEALAFCRSREAAEAMLTLALAGPADTRELATWWVQHNDLYDWREYGLGRHVEAQREWTDDQIVWRSGPLTAGTANVDVDIGGSRFIALAVTPADNGNGHDWADWLDPVLEGGMPSGTEYPSSAKPLWTLSLADEPPAWTSASAEWGEVRLGRNCAGGPLRVGGVEHARGIGTHASSLIVFRCPEDRGSAARLRATAAIDDGGSGQPGARTKVEFIVYADRALHQERRVEAAVRQRTALLDTLRSPAADLDTRLAAAESLAANPDGGALLLAEAAAGRLAALAPDDAREELLEAISDAIFRNPDLGIRALASEHFARPGTPTLPPISDLAALPGDRRAGEALFFGAARCDACHTVRGRGGDVGPDLTAIRTKLGRPELLDAILNPSAAIGAGLQSLTLTLQDGRVLAGLLQADGPTLLLKDGNGARHVIEAADVVERRPSRLSLMPEDIARALSPQQLADLVAFLQHDPDAPPAFGPPQPLWNGRDLSGWAAVPDASAWSVREVDGAPVLHCAGQPIGYIRTERAFTSFELLVEWRFPDPARPGNSGVLLRVQAPDGVWPRSLEAQLNSGDAGDIWNIGEFGALLDPARTQGRRTVKLLPSSERPLGEWNTYRITLRGGDLTLEVNGQAQNRARWCEELAGGIALQSEGAPIEFRRVELREIAD